MSLGVNPKVTKRHHSNASRACGADKISAAANKSYKAAEAVARKEIYWKR